MKKKLLATLSAICISVLGMAQAVLPASWGFATTTLPTGWASTGSGFSYYAASGNPAPAAKFVNTGDKLTISFNSTPGLLQYDLVGNPPPSSTWAGTFTVEESVNGTTWTAIGAAYTTLPTTYTTFSKILNSASRYARFNFTTKTTGNVGLDNVSLANGVSTAQEISVEQGATTIVNGGTYSTSSAVSTLLPITFKVRNLGTVTALQVTGTTILGPAASDYSVTTTTPFSVAASGNSNLVVNFTPSSAGTRNAVLSIANDDVNGNPYVINLNGIGGNLATEPTAQPTNITFSNTKSYRVMGSYTAASPTVDGYLVLRRTGAAITDVPVDGVVYQRGDLIGNSKVVYSNPTAVGFVPNEIVANTQYHFSVFAYNGVGTYRNYLTTTPLTGSVTTSGSMQPTTYYNGISTSSSTFVTDLHALTNPHTTKLYSDYGPSFAATFYTRDTTANQRVITCVYSGENKVYTEPFDWTGNNFSREHSYCQSWMPTVNASNFQNLPEYSDYHMLTPTNQIQVNAGLRSNYPFGEVVGTPLGTYLGCKTGLDINGKKVFEPRDSDKGDAARCLLYQCITYTGVAYSGPPNTNATYGGSWSVPSYISSSIPYGQDQNILKIWSQQDPPDNFEIARNDYVDSLQGNRNPFIDHPEYVCYIDFGNMTTLNTFNCTDTGIDDLLNSYGVAFVYPSPASNAFAIMVEANTSPKANVLIVNMLGEQIVSLVDLNNNGGVIHISDLNIPDGLYVIKISAGEKIFTSRILINK